MTRTDEALQACQSVWAATVKAQARYIVNAMGWHATTEAALDMIERNAGQTRSDAVSVVGRHGSVTAHGHAGKENRTRAME